MIMTKSDYYYRNVDRIEIGSPFLGCYLMLNCGHKTFHPGLKDICMEQFCIDCFNEYYIRHHQPNQPTSASCPFSLPNT